MFSLLLLKINMKFAIFRLLIVLFNLSFLSAFGQQTDNTPIIELSQTDFSMERPFTISVILPNSATRPVIDFPEIVGLSKRGKTASVTTSEINGKNVVSQVITQNYIAAMPGTYRLLPFTFTINGIVVSSTGAALTVRPVAVKSGASASNTVALAAAEKGGAFLSLTASRPAVYTGQGLLLKLAFYVAENYPYELRFDQVDRQLQGITKQIRPVGAWEENAGITELKPQPVTINGRAFQEFVMYRATFFPLNTQPIRLPAVTLTMLRAKPASTSLTTAPASTTVTEPVSFTSYPVTVTVNPLPARVGTGIVPVGVFRLSEGLNRSRLAPGQSTAYEFRIEGEGNIAALPAPVVVKNTDVDVFPPEVSQTVNRTNGPVTGQKTFRYFIVPKQNGQFSLGNTFQWVYFNPQTARYDTLRSRLSVRVGGQTALTVDLTRDSVRIDSTEAGAGSIYSGIDQADSSRQPLNIPVLVRAIANVLIVVMLLGIIYVFFKK